MRFLPLIFLQIIEIFSLVAFWRTFSVASALVKALNLEVLQVSSSLLPKSCARFTFTASTSAGFTNTVVFSTVFFLLLQDTSVSELAKQSQLIKFRVFLS